jgi:hypothetical protein
MLVSSAKGDIKALYRCNNVNLQILGNDFQADPIVLDFQGKKFPEGCMCEDPRYANASQVVVLLSSYKQLEE